MIKKQNKPWGLDKKNHVISVYASGHSARETSKITGVPRRTVRRWIENMNKETAAGQVSILDDSSVSAVLNAAKKIAITSYFDGTRIDEDALKSFEALADEGYSLFVIPITMQSACLTTKPTGKLPELPSTMFWATDKLIEIKQDLVLINNSGYRQRVSHFRDVASSVIVPHHSFTLLSTPNVFNQKVNYVISTGSISKLSSYAKNHAGMVMAKSHKLGCLLIDLDQNVMFQKDLADHSKPQTLVMGDVHLPFKNESDYEAFEAKLAKYIAEYNVKEVVFHDYVDFGFASHHLYNSGISQVQDRSLEVIDKTVNTLLIQHLSIVSCLTINNVKMRIVYSNHDSHYIKGLLSLHPKSLTNTTEQYLYYSLALSFLKDREKNPIEAFFDVLMDLLTPVSQEQYKKLCERVDFQFLSVYNNKQVGGYFLGLHGDHGANGARFTPEQAASIGVKLVVGHSHSASRFNDVLTVGTSSPLNMGYNAKGLSSWSACDVIIKESSAFHLVSL